MTEKKPNPLWKRIVRTILIIIGIIGGVGFINGFICGSVSSYVDPQTLTSVRFPLSYIDDAVVDRNGNIYCITDYYKRIQVYGSDGSFRWGWFVQFGKVNTGLDINEKSQIIAYTGSQVFTYNLEGKVIAQSTMTEEEKEMVRQRREEQVYLKSLDGHEYSRLGDRIFQINPTTNERWVVLADPWYLVLTKGPFPAWIWFFLCIIGLHILDGKKVKKEKTETTHYCFIGQTEEGTEKQGLIKASSDAEAAKIIKKHNMFPTKMTIASDEEKEQYADQCLS